MTLRDYAKRTSVRMALMAGACVAAVGAGTGVAAAADIELPNTIVWTAYDTGSSGYNQGVAVGSVLKNTYGVNLRVLPGKNDVSRLSPLVQGRAQFSATGSDSIYAQEAVYTFGTDDWGPQPIRILMHNINDGCSVAMATAADIGVQKMSDLKGKRVAWVRGAPALNKAVESMLAFGGLGWDDVEQVEVGGFGASIDGIINGDLDAANSASNSTYMLKMEASPRGVMHPPLPHDDEEGWARLHKVVPWYLKHRCMQGAGVPEGGFEGVTTAYPILISMTRETADLAYNMTKAMHVHYDEYKDGAPGANGWAADRQTVETFFLPVHEGAVRYYKEVGKWTDAAQANQEKNLARQKVIIDAWDAMDKDGSEEEFKARWEKARARALNDAGMAVIFDSW